MVFLTSYLTRMALMGHQVYPGGGRERSFYLVLLTSHVTLASRVWPEPQRKIFLVLHGGSRV